MSFQRVVKRYFGVTGITIAALIAACNLPGSGEDFMQPPMLSSMGMESACPTVEAMCDELGPRLLRLCPPEGDYRNHGEYMSCVATNLSHAIEETGLSSCFSSGDLGAIKGCVMEWMESHGSEGSSGAQKFRFHESE